jgi:tetratricopeptide (TPR) repeat protein
MNNESARSFLQSTDFSNDIEKVFFDIKANPQLHNIKAFSNIQSDSYLMKVKGILFMVGSIFRIDQIECDNDKIWNVRLTLCSVDDHQLKYLFQQMKNELGVGKTNLLQFANILYQMNKLNDSEKYYRRYLNQLPNNHPDISNCYQRLGMVTESKKNFVSSLKWYKRSLKMFQKTQELDNSNLADIYNNIANVYSKTKDYTNALKSYQKALDIWEKSLDENRSCIIKCLNNMGAVYDMKKKYSESLECYQKALKISKTKDPCTAVTLRNIANVYELEGEYKQALIHYEKVMKIYRDSSSPNEVYINDIQTSIQRVSSKLK